MGLKSYIRQKLINIIKAAIREELSQNAQADPTSDSTAGMPLYEMKEDTIQRLDKQIERWTWERLNRTDKMVEHWTWERFKRTDKMVEHWTWERFQRTVALTRSLSSQLEYYENKIPYYANEKIRIAILYQIPSCWPSIESAYDCLINDNRFEVTLLLYDRQKGEPEQMAGARDFLLKRNIPFKEAEYYDFRIERPHILLYQTPWDDKHRPTFLRSDAISSLGIRIAYIPYGISYSASVYPDFVFSENKFKIKPWLMFCLSEELRVEHQMLSKYGGHQIAVTGLPKFDSLYYKEQYTLSKELTEKIGSRKVVFMQMHFADKNGNPQIPVPNITEYLKFFEASQDYQNYFFMVRPHPKFFESYMKLGYEDEVKKMEQIIADCANIYLYDEPDYRPALFKADCVIGDRSALMIEAGILNVPVLYLTNFYYQERMLDSINPLFESYYQGNTCYDIEHFLDYVIEKGHDYKKNEREKAVEKCIPYFDGLCGKRIVDTIVKVISLEQEGRSND